MSIIFSLDLGNTTGYAISKGEKVIKSDSVSFNESRFQGGGFRFLLFEKFIKETLKLYKVDLIVFEAVMRNCSNDSAHVYGGFLAILQKVAEEFKVPYTGVIPTTIKKHFTGSGKASKDDMIMTAIKQGHSPSDDNEADAIALAYYAINEYQVPLS